VRIESATARSAGPGLPLASRVRIATDTRASGAMLSLLDEGRDVATDIAVK
jgi:hypothetical protein